MNFKATGTIIAGMLLAGCTVSPEGLTSLEVNQFTATNVDLVVANQEPVRGSIGLYEAMARALKYNLDFKVEMMNEALVARKFDLQKYDMLPSLVASSGYAGRDNYAGGSSRLIRPPKTTSLAPSTSSEKNVITGDLTFSWNILDFGLSYVRAKQAANKVLIAEERRRKVVNRIIEDVRTAYWRALSAQRLVGALSRLRQRVERALRNSRSLAASGEAAPLTAMTYERELIGIKRQIYELRRDLTTAKTQLAALMNVSPGSRFSLKDSRRRGTRLSLPMKSSDMIASALRNRPELREAMINVRITRQEADAALLELLPGANIYAAANIDTNDFLFNNNWLSWGAKASWNVMRLFAYPTKKAGIDAQKDLEKQRALAVTMAVMTQVHVARAKFAHSSRILAASRDYYRVQQRIRNKVRTKTDNEASSEQTLIREEMNALVARAKYDIAYAELQNAYANIYASMGVDPYPANITRDQNIKSLANSLRKTWVERGARFGA
ncbi:Outer membrane protein [hydrothermal vent metagenome]|uniref:Outer membrane protein n=1 Tax=hydrothermal vent metagenome TaxID=652676 RepID=A0A3B0S155_9ZZZZ